MLLFISYEDWCHRISHVLEIPMKSSPRTRMYIFFVENHVCFISKCNYLLGTKSGFIYVTFYHTHLCYSL